MTSEPEAVMRPQTSIVVPACAVAKVLRVAFTDAADDEATMDALVPRYDMMPLYV